VLILPCTHFWHPHSNSGKNVSLQSFSCLWKAWVLWAAKGAKLSIHLQGNRLCAIYTTNFSWEPAHIECHFTVDVLYVIGVYHFPIHSLLDEDREDKQSECWFYHVLTFGTHILIVGRILLDEYRTSNRSEFERAIASSYDSCQLSVDVGSVFRWHACICCRWCRWWAFLLLYCSERNTFGKNRSCRPRQSKCMEFWYDPWV